MLRGSSKSSTVKCHRRREGRRGKKKNKKESQHKFFKKPGWKCKISARPHQRVGGAGTIQCRCSFIFFVTRWNNDEWDPGKKWLQDVLISPHQASPLLSTYLHTKQQERTIGVSNTALSFSLSPLGLSLSLPAALYWWLYMNSQRQGKRSSSRILGAIMQTCSYQQLQDMYVTAPCAITSI